MKFVFGTLKGWTGKLAKLFCQKLFWKDGCMVRSLVRFRGLSDIAFHPDYIRLAALELCARKIAENRIAGSIAEVGVYKGEFAQKINERFPDRKFYLFDTFSGFDSKQAVFFGENMYLKNLPDFLDSDAGQVLSRTRYPQNCVIRQGVFPQTALGIDDKFVFVNLDVDLFEPVYEGLKFFYQKLVIGGYIFVHDYNNYDWPGVKKAVDQFCQENGISYVPIPDAHGTVVFLK